MNKKYNFILKRTFGLDSDKEIKEIINDIQKQVTNNKGFKMQEIIDEDKKEVNLRFNPNNEESKITNLLVAAGLPNEQFDKAENIYRLKLNDQGTEYKYNLHGYSQAGAYAQYAGILAEKFKVNQQIVTYNSIGLETFLKFNGNEFLGYKAGLLYYLNDLLNKDCIMTLIFNELIYHKVIEDGNISIEYRDEFVEGIKVKKMKEALIKVLNKVLSLEQKEAKKLVEESFNPYIIER
ncbi:MAG: hypothetical protein AWU54_2101, partial [Candidatus Frackibacter sp. T328-2]